MTNREDVIWFAGFYEGEGWICNDKYNSNKLRLGIDQNDPKPLYQAKEIWGGSITKRIRKSPASEKICTGYCWRIGHKDTLKFIEDIRPFMRIPYKIGQIETCIEISGQPFEGKFKCNFCDREYVNSSGRRRHEKKEHIAKGQAFDCDWCNKTYKSKDCMDRHIRINHNTNASQVLLKEESVPPGKTAKLRETPKTIVTSPLEKFSG